MIDLQKLVELLQNAELPEGEFEAWKKLIPLLPVEQIEELMQVIEEEQQQLTRLREEYLAKAQEVIATE